MAFLLDYLTSILVGSVVLVILFVSQFGSKQKEIDQQLYFSARRQTQAFTLFLERDFFNIGYGVGPTEEPVTEWTDSSFTFRRKVDSTDTSPVVDVRYVRRLHHSVALDGGGTMPVHEIVRFEDGVRVGGSTPVITDYSLELIRRDGSVTTDVAETAGVRVAFGSVYGNRSRDVVSNRSYHQRTYYPPELND